MKRYIAYLNVDLFDYFLIRNYLVFLEKLLHSETFFFNFNFFSNMSVKYFFINSSNFFNKFSTPFQKFEIIFVSKNVQKYNNG